MVDADELHAAQDELASARQTIKALHEMLQAHGVGVNFPELNYVLSPTVQRVIVEDEQSETPVRNLPVFRRLQPCQQPGSDLTCKVR